MSCSVFCRTIRQRSRTRSNPESWTSDLAVVRIGMIWSISRSLIRRWSLLHRRSTRSQAPNICRLLCWSSIRSSAMSRHHGLESTPGAFIRIRICHRILLWNVRMSIRSWRLYGKILELRLSHGRIFLMRRRV